MIQLTLPFSTLEEAQAALAAVIAHTKAPVATAAPATIVAQAEKAIEKAVEKATLAIDAPKAEPAAQPEGISYEVVKAAIVKLAGDKGSDAAAAVLAQFGVKKGPALKPEQYADVLAACEAA